MRDFVSEVNRMRTFGVHGQESYPEVAERTHASAWVPVTDILASGDDLVIRVELPGVEPDDVDLRLTRGTLTVSGKRESALAGETFLVRERYSGEFRRTVELPEGVEPEAISAEFVNGLVIITVTDGAKNSTGTQIALVDKSPQVRRRRLRK